MPISYLPQDLRIVTTYTKTTTSFLRFHRDTKNGDKKNKTRNISTQAFFILCFTICVDQGVKWILTVIMVTPLKQKSQSNKIFAIGCTKNCRNDNFWCNQWHIFRRLIQRKKLHAGFRAYLVPNVIKPCLRRRMKWVTLAPYTDSRTWRAAVQCVTTGPFHERFFFIVIQIRWKIGFSITQLYGFISLHNYAHATTVVPCAAFHSDHITTTWMRTGWNFHRIWILMGTSFVKWVPSCPFRYPISGFIIISRQGPKFVFRIARLLWNWSNLKRCCREL